MKLNELTLIDYIGFKFSKIKKLSWNQINDISIILGRNGTGKSSLLRVMLPTVLTRSVFNKNGYYKITLTHRGDTYVISSDFTNHTSPHSFRKNGTEELNLGGTSKVQQELITENLGLTPLLLKLLTVDIDFANMTPSNRKVFLTKINPSNMQLALDKHKIIVGKIKDCKGNLKLLYERKEVIESELITPELYKEMIFHRTKLMKDKETLVSLIYRLQPKLEELEKEELPTVTTQDEIKLSLKEVELTLHEYKDIDRKTYQDDLLNLQQKKAISLSTITTLTDDIKMLLSEINKYEDYLTKGDQVEIKQQLINKLEELKKYYNSLQTIPDTFTPIIKSELDHTKEHISKLYDLMLTFIDANYEDDIEWATIDYTKEKLDTATTELAVINSKLTTLTSELTELTNTRLGNYKIPDSCEKNKCELHLKYTEQLEKLNDKKLKIRTDIKQLEESKTKITDIYTKLTEKYTRFTTWQKLYQRYISLVTQTIPGLNIFSRFILSEYKSNYLQIYNKAIAYLNTSYLYHEKAEVFDQIIMLEKQTKSMTQDSKLSTEFITKLMQEKKDLLQTKRTKIEELNTELVLLNNQITTYVNYIDTKNKIMHLQSEMNTLISRLTIESSIEYYQDTLQAVKKTYIQVDEQLRELTKKIEHQDDLQKRLKDEIVLMILQVEEKQSKLEKIESALSPKTGFPHKHMISFINTIIANINVFISKVFTYKLQLLPIDESPLTYNFKVIAGDVLVPDISFCSNGQKAMINLAFCLAVMVQLELTDYPLLLDEVSRDLDSVHRQQLLNLLTYLIENELISQLISVGHNEDTTGLVGDTIHMDLKIENENMEMVPY